MKHLLFVLLCIPLTVVGQYNYIQPQANVNVHEMWEVAPLQYNRYNRPKSRQEFNSGIIFTGMAGLAFYFDTLGDGPFRSFGYVYGGVAAGKFIASAVWKKRENEWARDQSHYYYR